MAGESWRPLPVGSQQAGQQHRPGRSLRACRGCGAAIGAGLVELGLQPLGALPGGTAAAAEPVTAVGLELLVCPECRLMQPAHRVTLPAPPAMASERCVATLLQRFELHPSMPVTVLAGGGSGWLPMLRRFGFMPNLAQSGLAVARRLREVAAAPVLLLAGEAFAQGAALADMLAGLRELLAPGGVAVLDLPDLLAMLEGNRLDLFGPGRNAWPSLLVAELLAGQHGLVVFALLQRPGRLRLLLRHAEDATKPVGQEVAARRALERAAGLEGEAAYARFAEAVLEVRSALFDLLLATRREGRLALGLGAGASAARLLSACGIGPGLLAGTIAHHAPGQGVVLPGSRVQVLPPEALAAASPDLLVVLDGRSLAEARLATGAAGLRQARLALPVPELRVFPATAG